SWGVFGSNLLSGHSDTGGAFAGDYFSLTRLIMTQLHDARFDSNFGTLADFAVRCRGGELPSYAFLEPCYGGTGQNDQHPPADIRPGEQLIADVYGWIKASPAFARTLFIITYDEHGGCYDHVAPPGGARPPDREGRPGEDGFRFDRFGLRVPCVVINPHIRRGLIARPAGNTPFDHTSIIKTVQECFGLEGSLTERDRAAPDFSGLLGLDRPRAEDLPTVQPLPLEAATGPCHTNDLHRLTCEILQDMTGASAPDAAELVAFVQRSYNQVFRRC
ncbi:MAG: alkaline phosphatase family protein, partial [bacterium]